MRNDVRIMKFMGWGWKQYLETPLEVVNELVAMLNEE